jgi:hypothetical protein
MSKYIPGDAILKSVTITNNDTSKSFEITESILSIEVYESVTLPYVTASITVIDSYNLIEKLPMRGGEYIFVEFSSIRPKSKTVSLLLRVVEQKATTFSKNNKMIGYILRCVDIDFFTASTKKVSKSYKTTHDKMVSDIVVNVMGSQKILVEPTKGAQEMIIPNLNPYKAVDFIRRKATSTKYDYSPYYFFRTINDDYVFSTMANLYDSGTKTPKRKFTQVNRYISAKQLATPNVVEDDDNILSFIMPKKFNNTAKVDAGAFSSQTNYFDITTKQFKTEDYSFDKSTFKGKVSSAFDRFVKEQSKSGTTHYIVIDSTRPPTHEITTLGAKISYDLFFNDDILTIEVHGDETVSAGDVVEVTLPYQSTDEGDVVVERKTFNGSFLVTKVKHTVFVGPRTTFKSELQLVRKPKAYE